MSTETLYSHLTDLTHTPRVWGRLLNTFYEMNSARNTPTCVGKTLGIY